MSARERPAPAAEALPGEARVEEEQLARAREAAPEARVAERPRSAQVERPWRPSWLPPAEEPAEREEASPEVEAEALPTSAPPARSVPQATQRQGWPALEALPMSRQVARPRQVPAQRAPRAPVPERTASPTLPGQIWRERTPTDPSLAMPPEGLRQSERQGWVRELPPAAPRWWLRLRDGMGCLQPGDWARTVAPVAMLSFARCGAGA